MDLLPHQGLAAGEDFLDMAAVAAAVLTRIEEFEALWRLCGSPLVARSVEEVHVVIEDTPVTVGDCDQAVTVGKKLF
jgi:hypothetical protein